MPEKNLGEQIQNTEIRLSKHTKESIEFLYGKTMGDLFPLMLEQLKKYNFSQDIHTEFFELLHLFKTEASYYSSELTFSQLREYDKRIAERVRSLFSIIMNRGKSSRHIDDER